MGDRANIVVRTGPEAVVVFYTHWGGYEVPEVVQTAIAKRWRWTDPPYFARIVFDALTAGQHDQETGYGIDTGIGDNSYPILVLDPTTGTVNLHAETFEIANLGEPLRTWTFEEFVAIPDISWEAIS